MMVDGENENELLLTEALEEGEEQEKQAPEHQNDEDGEIYVEIEGEDEGPAETELTKRLRAEIRDRDRRLAEVTRATKVVDPGPKPTLEACEWDEDKFETALTTWHEAKRQAASASTEDDQRKKAQSAKFERTKAAHAARAMVLRIPNFEESQKAFVDTLGPEFSGLAMMLAKDSVKLAAAVGSKPALLAKLEAEDDPIERLKMLRNWEEKIVSNRKKPPEPEASTITRSTASIAPKKGDAVAEKLLEKAQRTGDMNEYNRHMKAKRAAA